MKLTEERVVELIDSKITDTQWKPFQTDWTPFWTSMLVVAWLICGLFHYQIQHSAAVYTVQSQMTVVYENYKADAPCQVRPDGIFNCWVHPSETNKQTEVRNWSNSDRLATLFSTLFGPVALIYDALTVSSAPGTQAGW